MSSQPEPIRYLSRSMIEALGSKPADVLAPMRLAFEDKRSNPLTEFPPKAGIHPRPDMMLHAALAYLPTADIAGAKWLSGYPHNPRLNGLPYFSGLYILNNAATGLPLAIMDATWITETRTAIATAMTIMAARPTGAGIVAILGTGTQGARHARVLADVLPGLTSLHLFDPDRERAETVARRLELDVRVYATGAEALDGANAAVSAIPTTLPPRREWDGSGLTEGAAVVALDHDSAWHANIFNRVRLYAVDDLKQYQFFKAERGFFDGYPDTAHELSDVLAGVVSLPSDGLMFFANLGIGLEDVVMAKVIFDAAVANDAGLRLER